MKVLVIGSGGREHAIIRKLRESPAITEIYALPGNGGISYDAKCVPIKATDIKSAVQFAGNEGIEFCVVAPDDPLCMGMVDAMEGAGIPCFGPDQKAAVIEGSKVFAKNLMKKYKIPTASYEVFDKTKDACDYISSVSLPVVVKADGLALGKGVIICHTREEAHKAIVDIMENRVFGDSGRQVVVEEFLTGPEVSVLAFTDGRTLVPMVSSMDHKRALDGDNGLNTGGMGTVAPNPFYTEDIAKCCMDTIFKPTVEAMNAEGRPFKGCLYFGLMLTSSGPKVIEYNCRFGDPETQVVLPLLESDLFTVMRAVRDETLKDVSVTFSHGSTCCVILASGGYPGAYQTGKTIKGLRDGQLGSDGKAGRLHGDTAVYHAGDRLSDDGTLCTSGGRVLGVTVRADSLQKAIAGAYQAVADIRFENMHMRSDIGKKALEVEGV